MKGGYRLGAGMGAQLINILKQVHQKVEEGVGLTSIITFEFVGRQLQQNQNPNQNQNANTQDLIVWVIDPNNPQPVPIAIMVNINVFDTPKCIERNPYLASHPVNAGSHNNTNRNVKTEFKDPEIRKVRPLFYNNDVDNLNRPVNPNGQLVGRLSDATHPNHFILTPDAISDANTTLMNTRMQAAPGHPNKKMLLLKSLGFVNFASPLIVDKSNIHNINFNGIRFEELIGEEKHCHKLGIFLGDEEINFDYTTGDIFSDDKLMYLQNIPNQNAAIRKNSNAFDLVYMAQNQRYGNVSNYNFNADTRAAYSNDLPNGELENSHFETFAEVIVPGTVNYCIISPVNKFSGYFSRDYTDKSDTTVREDIRNLQSITHHWDEFMNRYCYGNVPHNNWIQDDRFRTHLFGIGGVPVPNHLDGGGGGGPEINQCARRTTGPTGTNSVDLNAKKIIGQRVERELVTMCAKFDNYFYTRARLTQPQGEFISATFPGSNTPPTNYQQRSYAGVYQNQCTWTNGSSHHNVVYRGSNEAYRFRPNQYDANGNILHNWDPNLAGSHLLHGGLTMPEQEDLLPGGSYIYLICILVLLLKRLDFLRSTGEMFQKQIVLFI